MKRVVAVLFAAMIAAVLIFGLILIGVNAWVNPGSVPPSNSPAALVSMAALIPAMGLPAGSVLGLSESPTTRSRGQGRSRDGKRVRRAPDSILT